MFIGIGRYLRSRVVWMMWWGRDEMNETSAAHMVWIFNWAWMGHKSGRILLVMCGGATQLDDGGNWYSLTMMLCTSGNACREGQPTCEYYAYTMLWHLKPNVKNQRHICLTYSAQYANKHSTRSWLTTYKLGELWAYSTNVSIIRTQ